VVEKKDCTIYYSQSLCSGHSKEDGTYWLGKIRGQWMKNTSDYFSIDIYTVYELGALLNLHIVLFLATE
jgi:hypothetical protein